MIKVKYNFSLSNYINHYEFLDKIMERAKICYKKPSKQEKSLLTFWYNKTESECIVFGDISPEVFINDIQQYSLHDFPNNMSLINAVNQDFRDYLKTKPNLFVKNYNVQLLREIKPSNKVLNPNEEYNKIYKNKD
jgi:hypothetical protein